MEARLPRGRRGASTRLVGLGRWRWLAGFGCAAALAGMVPVPSAGADTAPPVGGDPADPPTVSADPLPTVQIDGVAWDQQVIGSTVYVGGRFSTARPAGAAPGTSTVTRSNLLAYDIRTGRLLSSWNASTNGTVEALAASPDGRRLYIGGSFTRVNGVTKNRVAVLTPTTGALVTGFRVSADATVRTIVATGSTVYLGGVLTSVNGSNRSRLAAVSAATGQVLAWAPRAAGGSVTSMALSPDGGRLVVGGAFTSMNGSSNPGFGLASVHPTTGANQSFPGNASVRNGGSNSSITKVAGDADSVYVSAFNFGGGGGKGNLEGVARFDWQGRLVWVEDCHGDSYGVHPVGPVVYVASHHHYCGNLAGGFVETVPRSYYFANAFSKAVTGTAYPEYHLYFDWAGTPTPSLLAWHPRLDVGSFTGQNQAAWDVDGNAEYVVVGGEFPRAASSGSQQGLVRYAVSATAPDALGPVVTGYRTRPTVTSPAAGELLVCWQTNWDRDNTVLTYRVIRNSNSAAPAHTETVASAEWDRPYRCWRDTGLPPGATVRYRIYASDPWGNLVKSDHTDGRVSGAGSVDGYASAVLADDPASFWRLDEPSGTSAADLTGLDPLTLTSSVTRGVTGVKGRAVSFTGSSGSTSAGALVRAGSQWFSVEAWFKTTSSAGGKVVGFGNARSGSSSAGLHDRHVYLDNSGRVLFGVRNGRPESAVNKVVASPRTYRDGGWHHVVGTVGDDGTRLYVDGSLVASNADVRSGHPYDGAWRVGGDNLSGWPSRPTSSYLKGTLDEVAVYRHALDAERVRAHFLAR